MNNTGIYVHIPFCAKKCPYCDFYSKAGTERDYDEYTDMLCKKITESTYRSECTADTLYFGGGTPSIIGAGRLAKIISSAKSSFGLDAPETEITVEVNPAKEDIDFALLQNSGCNRISIGLQSANDNELQILGRLHDCSQAELCISRAQSAGFENISLDLMIALPNQTKESLHRSVDFCAKHNAKHISAYILKIEEGTVFYKNRHTLSLPDDDEAADMYEYLCELMREYGYEHYEISNFCKSGYESRHNLKYWHDEEYIGFGPSAHSFFGGKRFYCPRNMQKFRNDEIVSDGSGGDIEEFIMLGLRLSEGITNERFHMRFGINIPSEYINRAKRFEKAGLVTVTENGFSLTEQGFMVSNALISQIL